MIREGSGDTVLNSVEGISIQEAAESEISIVTP